MIKGFTVTLETIALQLEHVYKFQGKADLIELITLAESMGYSLEDVEVYLETGIKPTGLYND